MIFSLEKTQFPQLVLSPNMTEDADTHYYCCFTPLHDSFVDVTAVGVSLWPSFIKSSLQLKRNVIIMKRMMDHNDWAQINFHKHFYQTQELLFLNQSYRNHITSEFLESWRRSC